MFHELVYVLVGLEINLICEKERFELRCQFVTNYYFYLFLLLSFDIWYTLQHYFGFAPSEGTPLTPSIAYLFIQNVFEKTSSTDSTVDSAL